MKNLAIVFLSTLVLASCSEYHKVLNKGEVSDQYQMAVKMYEANKYSKSLRLFEKITPSFRGKPQMERIQYMVANANLNEKNYGLAGYYFDRFATNYPKSSKKEEADFLSALSYYKASPSFSLDPTDTNKAINSFQSFIDNYPDSDRIEEANKYYNELRFKLEKKDFEIAKTYYRTAEYDYRNYQASIAAFDNLLEDYLGTKYKEEALYYRFKASHDFAVKSVTQKKGERIKAAEKAYEKFKKNFPESKFKKESDEMYATLQTEKEQLDKIKNRLQLIKS